MNNNRLGKYFLWILIFSCGSTQALEGNLSNIAPEEEEQAISDAGQNTLNALMKEFKPDIINLAPELYIDEHVIVTPNSDYNAFADIPKKKIIIPFSFVEEIYLQAQALFQITDEHRDLADFQRYLQYMAQAYNDKLHGKSQPVKSYWFWANINPPCCDNAEQQKKSLSRISSFMYESLAFPLAHEIGHIAFGHKAPNDITPSVSREQELEADGFALYLLDKHKIDVDPFFQSGFFRFALIEANGSTDLSENSTHPSAACRYERLVRPIFKRISNSPEQKETFNQNSKMQFNEAIKYFKKVRTNCEKNNLYVPA
ncbi:hypothetical protein J3D54_004653 [Pseudomonas sp. GGS8]|uniref:ImmA/IrrE family metallo-endopeptidase n=1 Tax=Pseudomonas sp. GGS8 TaxID=2817892 RepID=UPI0020A1B908|nr:ImmA/IrrE family metallo-endopeptidase [Pseudomonas sp. GGS8]MCP1445521.1 hypothetical protein [Pseudomonas sp. GGS8]